MASVLMAVSLVATPLIARADHTVPGTEQDPQPCNNTYFEVSHTGFSHSYEVEGHKLSNGKDCIPTRLVFIHQKRCSVCKAVLQTSWYFQCEEWHSRCGTVIKGLGH